MLKLDIDHISKKVTRFLISLQKPYEIRTSPGGKGIHLRSECPGCSKTQDCYDCWVYRQFDDKKRLKLCISNKYNSLSHNILNDVKKGKRAGDWKTIESELDIDRFLRQFTGFY